MEQKSKLEVIFRKSTQHILPQHAGSAQGGYTLYPYHSLGHGYIFTGFDTLAKFISSYKTVIIDGYAGIFWDSQIEHFNAAFQKRGLSVKWHKIADCLLAKAETDRLVAPFLGTGESVWGTKCTLDLKDFFQKEKLAGFKPDSKYDINIVIGTGAALVDLNCPIIYADLPKNELQYRARACLVYNLGNDEAESYFKLYKRFYFVDWVVLNEHKRKLLPKINIVADGQWNDSISWMTKDSLLAGLDKISRSAFRVRPWFEAGAWGGQWMKEHLKGLNKNELNYAWSFELITPENGIVFESDGNLLEVSFDFLMFCHCNEVLGKDAGHFKTEFPIRFDFLDTFDGGNLSIQCHPSLKYIRENFGETITQDETYYILDCKDDAKVYLGFQENIQAGKFREALESSRLNLTPVDIDQYVQSHNANKHDLFLIPNGTVHSAGKNNLVLEISATPYIFTFKMYDWLRLDLDGKPRPINIEHAFKNLNFDRKGDQVKACLISKTQLIEQGNDWALYHLPTHKEHFYDVHRVDFNTTYTILTNNGCVVLMLVEGESITVKSADGTTSFYFYAETFVIPAAAIEVSVINNSDKPAKLIMAFIKPDYYV